MKLLFFGTGRFYQDHKQGLEDTLQGDEVIGFVDNRARDIGCFEGLPVYLPRELLDIAFDRVVLTSGSQHEMRAQLLELGIPKGKIAFYEEHIRTRWQEKVALPHPRGAAKGKKRILIITHEMDYGGASIVAMYAARALMVLGHVVTLAAPTVRPSMKKELAAKRIDFVLCPAIPYLGAQEMAWIEQYDVLLVNVFPNIRVACSMRKRIPVIWWIHEADDAYTSVYPDYRERFEAYDSSSNMDGIKILGVSKLAAEIFLNHYPECSVGVMPYGIPDGRRFEQSSHRPFVLALVGGITQLKGQREFLQAVQMLERHHVWAQEAEIWLIGNMGNNAYADEVRCLVENMPNVKMRGLMTREEIRSAYQEIDIMVSASQQEMLSTVMVEGLMHGKICLMMKNNGLVSYLHDGIDSYICEDNQPKHIAQALERMMGERDRWDEIRQRARAVYEEHFTMKKFAERLEHVLQEL